ncbi:MAG: hypothetical protein K2Q20_06660, partial [Phycisphaerales bacterium]|nr:hypothetical protein [Phycisphaerales bacterium]
RYAIGASFTKPFPGYPLPGFENEAPADEAEAERAEALRAIRSSEEIAARQDQRVAVMTLDPNPEAMSVELRINGERVSLASRAEYPLGGPDEPGEEL